MNQRVLLISGGSRGLGQALVADALHLGARVATFSRSGSEFIEECRRRRAEDRFFWQPIDATDTSQLRDFVAAVARRFGRIDALVNNAAAGAGGLLALMGEDDMHHALAVNLESVLCLTRACVRVMLTQGGGDIVNISSVHALRGHAGVSVYSATKAALDGLTRSLAREVGERGIRVNSVAPGFFDSDMVAAFSAEQRQRIVRQTPLGRLATTDDVVAVVRFLLSPSAAFLTGQTIVVDGGLTC